MKIVNVNQNHYLRGGSDAYFFALADLLRIDGHAVVPFASAQSKNESTEWSRYFPAPVNFDEPSPSDIVRFIYSPAAASAMKRLVAEQQPDLAHLHIYYGQLTASILGPLRRAGVPVVQTLHEYKIVCPTSHLLNHGVVCEACQGRRFAMALVKRCNRGSLARSALSAVETYISHRLGAVDQIDHFLAVSDFVRRKVIQLGVPANKVSTVHNFVNVDHFTPSTAPGEYVMYFGRLERLKGISTLLRAMQLLPELKLLVVGEGKDGEHFRSQARELQLNNVDFLGFRRGVDLHNLIRGSICTVTPSECFETFGLALVESFALGRPVVCSNMGGMPEVVRDGEDGLIFESGNAQHLAEHLKWLSKNPAAAIAMGSCGRRKVERSFSAPVHLSAVRRVYDRVMRNG